MHLKLDKTLPDWLTASMPQIMVSYFHFFHLYLQQQKKLWRSGYQLANYDFLGCLIHIYLQYVPPFDSLILSNTFLYNFLLVFWLATFAFTRAHSYSLSTTQGLVICLRIFICIFQFFVESLSFGFSLVSFEHDTYLAVDHSLDYGYPIVFLLFINLILTAWAWFITIFLDSYFGLFLFIALKSSYLLN